MKGLAANMNAVKIKEGLTRGATAVIEDIKRQTLSCNTKESILQVATVSANNDKKIGQMLTDAIAKTKTLGSVTITDGTGFEDLLEIVEGLQVKSGYMSPHFVPKNSERSEIEFSDAHVLVSSKNISNMQDIIPLLETVSREGKPLVVIAEDVSVEILNSLIINNMRGVLKTVAVKAPDFGDARKDILEDIATITGAQIISEINNKIDFKMLGKAGNIKITKDNTTIVRGAGSSDDIKARIAQVNKLVQSTDCPKHKQEQRNKRLANLTGGIAVIKVGGFTETEMKEKKDRCIVLGNFNIACFTKHFKIYFIINF
jgi:chaperonin GroEL